MQLNQYLLLLMAEKSSRLSKESIHIMQFGMMSKSTNTGILHEDKLINGILDFIALLIIIDYCNINLYIPFVSYEHYTDEYKDKILKCISNIFKQMKSSVFSQQLQMTIIQVNDLEKYVLSKLNGSVEEDVK